MSCCKRWVAFASIILCGCHANYISSPSEDAANHYHNFNQTEINQAVAKSNFSAYFSYLDPLSMKHNGNLPPKTARWNTNEGLIPIYVRENAPDVPIDPRITKAVDDINQILGPTLATPKPIVFSVSRFQGALRDKWDAAARGIYAKEHITHGLIFSIGSTYSPPWKRSCGNPTSVALGPYLDSPDTWIYANDHYIEKNWVTWINIDTSDCHANGNQVKHALAKSLGLYNNFMGFSEQKPWSKNAASVLKTLYKNPPKTSQQQLKTYE